MPGATPNVGRVTPPEFVSVEQLAKRSSRPKYQTRVRTMGAAKTQGVELRKRRRAELVDQAPEQLSSG